MPCIRRTLFLPDGIRDIRTLACHGCTACINAVQHIEHGRRVAQNRLIVYRNGTDGIVSLRLTLPVGGSAQIAYTVLPNDATNKNVTITSSDTSVVTVSGTVAVGQANGIATLTLTTENGGYTAVVQVVVQGDYTWYDYPVPLDILNAEDVQHLCSNMDVLPRRI